MKIKTLLSIGIPGLLFLGLVGWRFQDKARSESQIKQQQKARTGASLVASLATVKAAVIENGIDVVGTLESPYVNRLAAQGAGTVEFIQVREGDKVRPGQVIASLDQAELKGQVLAANSALAEAKSRLAQAQLVEASTNLGVRSQAQKDKAGLNSTIADTAQVRASAASQLATANAALTDAKAKLSAANSQARSAQSDLNAALANQANAKVKFERISGLYKDGFAAPQDVDDARTAADVQTAAVESARNKLKASEASVASARAVVESATEQLKVKKNQLAADVAAADARLTQSKATYQVSQANHSQIQAYQSNLTALRAAVSAAEGQLRQAEARLANQALKATIEGTVTSRSVDPGSVVSSGQAIAVVQFTKWLYVTAQVPGAAAVSIRPGMDATFTVEGIEQTFSAKVALISGAADPATRQVLVRLKVDNADGVLRPGAFARIHMGLQAIEAAMTLPISAIQPDANDPSQGSVFVVGEDHKAHKTAVSVGAQNSTLVEVKEGLKPGDKVVLLAARPPREGQEVSEEGTKSKGRSKSKGGGAK